MLRVGGDRRNGQDVTKTEDAKPSTDEDRRQYPRLRVDDRGVILMDGRMHPLIDCSLGGFLCYLPEEAMPSAGESVEVRLVLSADGSTVGDFDVSAKVVRQAGDAGNVGVRIVEVSGVAAHRFESFLEECRARGRKPLPDEG